MTMLDKLTETLNAVGVSRGDHLLVYSNTASIVKIADLRSLRNELGAGARDGILAGFHAALRAGVGDEGTILTIGSFTDYARYGRPFHEMRLQILRMRSIRNPGWCLGG